MNRVFQKYELKLVADKVVPYNVKEIIGPKFLNKLGKELELHEKAEEEFYLVCLDAQHHPIGIHMISRGTLNMTMLSPREVFKRAILNNAYAVAFIHNHPSKNPTPSEADYQATKELIAAGELLKIPVADHVVMGDGEQFESIRENDPSLWW